MSDPPAQEAGSKGPYVLVLLLALCAGLWLSQTRGLLSSNDGSHLALARALALRQETHIDPDVWMTLGVDLAVREGATYSDRPPGTGMAAVPAAAIGHALDPALNRHTRSSGAIVFLPASALYATTANKRFPDAPPLSGFQGTALALAWHGTALALLGLLALWSLARRLFPESEETARVVALASLGIGSAYAGYVTPLFSHLSTTVAVAGCLYALHRAREETGWRTPAAAGALAGWAIACEYSLVVALPLLIAVALPRDRWLHAAAGVLPVALLVAAYHQAAFGSAFAIGYDFQPNFEFSRERGSTFGANPLQGLWVLLGAGRDAGWLARGPIFLLGLTLALARPGPLRRWTLCFVPWLLLIASHQTPWGGAGEDYRYITPLLPLATLGLAGAPLGGRPRRIGLVLLALASASMWWRGFWEHYELQALPAPGLGLFGALLVAAVGVVVVRRRAP